MCYLGCPSTSPYMCYVRDAVCVDSPKYVYLSAPESHGGVIIYERVLSLSGPVEPTFSHFEVSMAFLVTFFVGFILMRAVR